MSSATRESSISSPRSFPWSRQASLVGLTSRRLPTAPPYPTADQTPEGGPPPSGAPSVWRPDQALVPLRRVYARVTPEQSRHPQGRDERASSLRSPDACLGRDAGVIAEHLRSAAWHGRRLACWQSVHAEGEPERSSPARPRSVKRGRRATRACAGEAEHGRLEPSGRSSPTGHPCSRDARRGSLWRARTRPAA